MNSKDSDIAVDDLFAVARQHDLIPSGDLMTRVLADAADVQAQAAIPALPAASSRQRWFCDLLGG